jgi:fructose/tagatose bisphosphate aldolase
MPLVPFHQLMAEAEGGGYAVGYFESWNLESLMAVADAAEAMRSPVILGFSGIYLTNSRRIVKEPLSVYAAMGLISAAIFACRRACCSTSRRTSSQCWTLSTRDSTW